MINDINREFIEIMHSNFNDTDDIEYFHKLYDDLGIIVIGTKDEFDELSGYEDIRNLLPVHPRCRCTWLPVVGNPILPEPGKLYSQYRNYGIGAAKFDDVKKVNVSSFLNKVNTTELKDKITKVYKDNTLTVEQKMDKKNNLIIKYFSEAAKDVKYDPETNRMVLDLNLNNKSEKLKNLHVAEDVMGYAPETLNKAKEWLSKNVAAKVIDDCGAGIPKLFWLGDSGKNSYYDSVYNIIKFGSKDPSVFIHEYMHYLQSNNGRLYKTAEEFFLARTKDEEVGGTSSWKYKKDNFIDKYAGTIYDKGIGGGNIYGSEIFSVGLEAMYDNPDLFYQKDPEHFYLTLSMMLGLY